MQYMSEQLTELNAQFEDAPPQAILKWVASTFGAKFAVVTSFQHTGIATLHMLQAIAPGATVLTVDTGVLFPQTYALMDEVEALFDLNLHRITSPPPEYIDGVPLWEHDPDACCHARKVLPLQHALQPYDAWLAGLRRDQSPTRAHTPVIQNDVRSNAVKIAPFATWTEDMVLTYIKAHNLPYNELYDEGYASIGCMPCTRPIMPDEDGRAGRWAGKAKTECGIHLHEHD